MGEIPGGTDKKLSDNHTQIPTGITQNVKDLLSSREIENILENSDFMILLAQAAGDRAILAKQLNISEYQLSYITHSQSGEGLVLGVDEEARLLLRLPDGQERAFSAGEVQIKKDFLARLRQEEEREPT